MRDFFRGSTASGATYCEMMQANNKHEWSWNGVEWSTPFYDASDENGSSQSDWPKTKGGRKDDNRQYLTIWGRDATRANTGGCCSNSYLEYNSGFGKAFTVYYAIDLQPLPPNTGMSLVTKVAGTTLANDAFWTEECQKIPSNTLFLVLDMGAVRDFFRPADSGTRFCDMLLSHNKHQWSANGVDWIDVEFRNHNGGSKDFWPRDKGRDGDERKFLSFWGADGSGYSGGCCSSSTAIDQTQPSLPGNVHTTWGQSFALSYAIDLQPLPPNTGVSLVADVAGTTKADDAYWAEKCQSMTRTGNVLFVVVDMGAVRDFFKPTKDSTTVCEMLQSNDKHSWSGNGIDWVVPEWYASANFRGGSGSQWPRTYVDGDERKRLSFWGRNAVTASDWIGGCCSSSTSEYETYPPNGGGLSYNQPFTLSFAYTTRGTCTARCSNGASASCNYGAEYGVVNIPELCCPEGWSRNVDDGDGSRCNAPGAIKKGNPIVGQGCYLYGNCMPYVGSVHPAEVQDACVPCPSICEQVPTLPQCQKKTTIFTASFEGPEWKDGTDSIVAGAARYFNKNYWRSYANTIDATYSQDYARTGETSLKHRMPLSGRYVSDAAGGIEGTLGFGGSFFDILVEPESTYQVTAWALALGRPSNSADVLWLSDERVSTTTKCETVEGVWTRVSTSFQPSGPSMRVHLHSKGPGYGGVVYWDDVSVMLVHGTTITSTTSTPPSPTSTSTTLTATSTTPGATKVTGIAPDGTVTADDETKTTPPPTGSTDDNAADAEGEGQSEGEPPASTSASSTGTIVGVVLSLLFVVAVVGGLFMMRKKEQSRQRALTRGGGGGGRANRQQRQGRNEHVQNNAAFDAGNDSGNDSEDDSHMYGNDAYQNVPQSTLNRDQVNRAGGGGGGAAAAAGSGGGGGGGAAAGGGTNADAVVYLEADLNQPAVYDEANNILGAWSSLKSGGGPHYDMPQEEYAALGVGKAVYASSTQDEYASLEAGKAAYASSA